MPIALPLRSLAACGLLAACVLPGPVAAEKADRGKPIAVESDQACQVDLVKESNVCSGNVVIAQGTLLIRADRVELRKGADGYQTASASGSAAKPAQYRQKRDGVDEYVEGVAQRIVYDERSNTLRFEGQASARRLRGTVPADEIYGNVITWDNTGEVFNVQGGSVTPANPGGRVRAVLSPRPADAAASAPPPAASAPATRLRSSSALGERR
ncbi:MAG: lipopolysaccharide transport periplasmic protein LptA [Burkholderiales bacterium]|nr:lipopolysaccharide transport periplasmic protein LptA [Burkholderiales bacterium]